MKNYKKIFFWQNNYRINQIKEFLDLYNNYVETFKSTYSDDSYKEDRDKYESKIALKSGIIEQICFAMDYLDTPIREISYPFLPNKETMIIPRDIPKIVKFQVNKPSIFNRYDDENYISDLKNYFLSILGKLESNKSQSLINTLNPFVYLSIFSDFLLSPLYNLFGVKEDKTMFWKSIKILVQTILMILAYFGITDIIK
jgi:hypothetical protein